MNWAARERRRARLEAELRRILAELPLNPSVALDLFVYTPEEFTTMAEANPFVRSAIASGKVIYEA